MSRVKTPAWSPKSESSTAATASRKSSYAKTVTSGANASVRAHVHLRRCVDDDGRFEEGAVPTSAGEDSRASLDGLADEPLGPLGGTDRDHRDDVGRLIGRGPTPERPDAVGQLADEVVEDRPVHVHALDADAGLPGEPERTGRYPARGVGDVRILVDDRPGVAAELERDLLAPRQALQVPADLRRARERQLGDPLVVDGALDLGGVAGDDAQAASRPAGRLDQSREAQGRERGRGLRA